MAEGAMGWAEVAQVVAVWEVVVMAVVARVAVALVSERLDLGVGMVAMAMEAAIAVRPAEGWATTVEVVSAMVVEEMAAVVAVLEVEEKAAAASVGVGLEEGARAPVERATGAGAMAVAAQVAVVLAEEETAKVAAEAVE